MSLGLRGIAHSPLMFAPSEETTFPTPKNLIHTKSTHVLGLSEQSMIRLRCVNEGNRLRVKVVSPGYSPDANCQFPRAIRAEGREYLVPEDDISLANTRGQFFYRVNKTRIQIVNELNMDPIGLKDLKVYGEETLKECCVCMNDLDSDPDLAFIIFAPCGHYCCCTKCAEKLTDCPICRAHIQIRVRKEQLA
jgi:hypothetical protein